MINKLLVTDLNGITMVEIKETLENDSPVLTIKDEDKMAMSFKVKRQHPTSSFFKIYPDKGSLPKELEGSFTGLKLAEDQIVSYLKRMKPTATAKRNQNTARREAQKRDSKDRSKL